MRKISKTFKTEIREKKLENCSLNVNQKCNSDKKSLEEDTNKKMEGIENNLTRKLNEKDNSLLTKINKYNLMDGFIRKKIGGKSSWYV